MTEEIKQAAIRRFNAQEMLRALATRNTATKREDREARAVQYALAEHELYLADEEYKKLVRP